MDYNHREFFYSKKFDDYNVPFRTISYAAKNYIENNLNGLIMIDSCDCVATPENFDPGFLYIDSVADGIALSRSDRVLVIPQQNRDRSGIYIVEAIFDIRMQCSLMSANREEVEPGTITFIENGNEYINSCWCYISRDDGWVRMTT